MRRLVAGYGGFILLAGLSSSVMAAPAPSEDGAGPEDPEVALADAPSSSALPSSSGGDPRASVGIGTSFVGPLGSFEGGLTLAGNLGYALTSSLRLTLSGEKSVTRAGYTNCTCGPHPCCAGANPSYGWLGAGLEARVGLGRWVDLHAAGDVGVIARNAWRPAARTNIGFDVKLGRVALGPVLGLIVTSRDSLFDDRNGNRLTGYFGLRLALALNL